MKWLASILDDVRRWSKQVIPPAEPDVDEKIKEVESHLVLSSNILNGLDNLKRTFEHKRDWANAGHVDAARLIVERLHRMIQQDRELLIDYTGGDVVST